MRRREGCLHCAFSLHNQRSVIYNKLLEACIYSCKDYIYHAQCNNICIHLEQTPSLNKLNKSQQCKRGRHQKNNISYIFGNLIKAFTVSYFVPHFLIEIRKTHAGSLRPDFPYIHLHNCNRHGNCHQCQQNRHHNSDCNILFHTYLSFIASSHNFINIIMIYFYQKCTNTKYYYPSVFI